MPTSFAVAVIDGIIHTNLEAPPQTRTKGRKSEVGGSEADRRT
jgi:hypothetical protein